MPSIDEKLPMGGAGSGTIAGNFEVSVRNGKIVLHALKEESSEFGDVLLAGDGEPSDGLRISAEIIAQAKGEKVVVFKKRRRHNYRRKKNVRQQHTILRIVAISELETTVEDNIRGESRKAKGERTTPESAPANNDETERELQELAVQLNGAAERMSASLDRATEAVRTALNPKREIAVRKRLEAEIAGGIESLFPGME